MSPEEHLGLVWREAQKVARQRWSYDTYDPVMDNTPEEFVGYGWIGLEKASTRFDGSAGFKFSTYACKRIRGEILDSIHSVRTGGQSKPRPQFSDIEINRELVDSTPLVLDQIARESVAAAVRDALDTEGLLSNTERESVVRYYWYNQRQYEIAVFLGITESAISQALTRARRKLFPVLLPLML